MKIISITEANQSFSKLIRKLEQDGEGYVILRRGRPIARLLPSTDERQDDPEWQSAYARMIARFREGAHLGGLRIDRNELHER